MAELAFYLSVGWFEKAITAVLELPADMDMWRISSAISGHDVLLLVRLYP